ncbi:MAG TPA: biotin/lipoyl-containing protein [Thermoanaerobaculia bacterium]|nr:biotin/lipoyl-containing protein [Thermoanaerobaculia bacterium]
MKLSCGPRVLEVRLENETAILGERRVRFRLLWRDRELDAIEIGGETLRVRVARQRDVAFVWCAGKVWEIRRVTSSTARPAEPGGLLAPMPGRVRRTLVAPGERVAKGQVVLILEAMKMEHAIRAPRDGVVSSIAHGEGDLVEAGTALAEIT